MTRKQHLNRLKKIYADIPEDKADKAKDLLEQMADLKMMIDECKEHLKEEGYVTKMQQGEYVIMRENPYSKVFDSKYKLMLSTHEKLNKLAGEKAVQKDELEAFLDD